jgi:dTDP-4-dehydrorhamnose reductase
MKVVVLGGGGALGVAAVDAFRAAGHDAVGLGRGACDVTDLEAVRVAITYPVGARVDVVVNCAGLIPERKPAADEMVLVNAYAPHVIAQACAEIGARLIHVSTDCVFYPDGRRWRFPNEEPDATDLYGRTKALGEQGVATSVRTSFVTPGHGLWRWYAEMAAGGALAIPGWANAMWSGSTVWAVAEGLVRIAEGPFREPVVHLATAEPISKAAVLMHLRKHLGASTAVEVVQEPHINRALMPTVELEAFREALARAPR